MLSAGSMRTLSLLVGVLPLVACSSLPPAYLQLSVQTQPDGQVEVRAQADQAFVGDKKNAPASVKACVDRRYGELEHLGFGQYVKEFRKNPKLAPLAPRLSGCAFDRFDDDSHDRMLLPFTLHESTHLLGSILEGVCPNGASRCESKRTRYRVYSPRQPEPRIEIPYVPTMPAVNTITKELGADTMLDTLRTYLGLPSRKAAEGQSVDVVTAALGQGDFYLLWDEWNAYLTSLEISTAQAVQTNCWMTITFDTYETALSWPDLIERYLHVLETTKPALYKALVADGRFGAALRYQLDRSERAIGNAAKHDCVRRGIDEVVAAEAAYGPAYSKLRARATK